MKKTLALLVSFVMFAVLGVKGADPVTWSYKLIDENTDHPAVQMTATVPPDTTCMILPTVVWRIL